ncbi:hypothetical protein CNECB9_820006 [Cupriavidus necator]|uniref:Acetoacetate decarboxylase n=1 Tax=Cupriavidus necator TaxID=106590 RepID=A0A1K0ISH2_CUPNE|nr:hypothetical protein CNECB9_820006 [Cupriavidus necator]
MPGSGRSAETASMSSPAPWPTSRTGGDLSSLSQLLDFSNNFNLKAVDHIDGTPAIRQLTARRLANVQVHECWEGPCTVELRPNIQAPVYRLPVVEMLHGFYWRGDFTLVQGSILHDYLAQ